MKHLSDAEIQDYVDKGGTSTAAAHLETCPVCKQQVKYYRALFVELEKPLSVAIPEDFPKTALAKIEVSPAFFDMRIWQFLIPLFALAAGVISTVYTTGSDIFKKIIGVLGFLPSTAKTYIGLLSEIHIDFGLLGLGLLSLLVLTALDHFVLKDHSARKS